MATITGKNARGGIQKESNYMPRVTSRVTNTAGEKVVNYSDGSKTRNGLETATPQDTASGSLKDLSIGLANQPGGGAGGASSPLGSNRGGSLKDLSIGLAGKNPITQADILSAQSGGASLASRTASQANAGASSGGTSPVGGTTGSNQTGIAGAGNTRYSRYGNEDEPVVEQPNLEDIQKKMTRDAQKEINSLYKYQSDLLAEQQGINKQDDRSTASINTLTGLAGSTEANINQQATTAKGQQANQQIMNAVQTQVQGVLSAIRKDAQSQYQYERTESRLDAETQRANREEFYKKAQENTKLLAQSGATAEGYKNTDPEGYQHLVKQLGSEELVKATFTLNRPIEQVVERKIEGGKLIQIYENPLTGKSTIETLDLGLPVGYSKTIDAGDRILAIPDNWDGDPSNLVTINKGLTPSQAQAGTGTGIDTGDVSPAAQNIIDQINLGASLDDLVKGTSNAAQKLRNEVLAGLNAQGGLTTKSYEILKDGKEVVDAMLNSKAYKALGGYSSILGGQYSTAYGDAMAQASQLQAILARDNLGLLKGAMSDKDLAFIQAMSSGFEGQGTQSEAFIKERFESIQKKLADKISKVPTETATGGSSGTLTSPDGTQEVNIADLTPEEIQEARDAGWNE